MSHLLREHAPITAAGWSRIDEEARERLTPALAARKLVDFAGPHGWQHSATNLGRTEPVTKAPRGGLTAARRRVLPLVELRARVRGLARGAGRRRPRRARTSTSTRSTRPRARSPSPRTPPSSTAGRRPGSPASPRRRRTTRVALGDDCERYPRHVAKAVEALLAAGIDGPYGLALGPERLHPGAGDERARRLPAARAPARDRRRPARVGARRRRRRRRQPARRRLPVRVGRGHLDRLRPATTPTPSTCISKRASASACSRRRPPSRWLRHPDPLAGLPRRSHTIRCLRKLRSD